MDQRISLVTLAVADLDVSRRFYIEGLGWEAFVDVPGDVLMIQAGQHLLFSLWVEPHFEAEVGAIRRGPGVAPITITHNVGSDAEVDAVLATAGDAGADPVQPGVKREWGGYSGYFGDPDGYRWEIAHAPGQIGDLVIPR